MQVLTWVAYVHVVFQPLVVNVYFLWGQVSHMDCQFVLPMGPGRAHGLSICTACGVNWGTWHDGSSVHTVPVPPINRILYFPWVKSARSANGQHILLISGMPLSSP